MKNTVGENHSEKDIKTEIEEFTNFSLQEKIPLRAKIYFFALDIKYFMESILFQKPHISTKLVNDENKLTELHQSKNYKEIENKIKDDPTYFVID